MVKDNTTCEFKRMWQRGVTVATARTTFTVHKEGVALGSRHNLNRDSNDNTDYRPRGAGSGSGDPDGDDDGDSDLRDGDRGNNRNPQYLRKPRDHREDTYDSGFTSTTRAEAVKIKRDDIGIFDPHYEDPNDLGIMRQLRVKSLMPVLDALITRFQPDALTATRQFSESYLSLKDVARDDQALMRFVQKKLR
ncbi:hypothetical protein N0V88_005113 [Collariella sp. IMI 366227]|nr:hypothetical protein N0V88_005113 [Collariella sp. IMI 366227]